MGKSFTTWDSNSGRMRCAPRHGKPLPGTDEAIAELGGIRNIAVLAAFANGRQVPRISKLAVHTMPGSATPAEQLHAAGIDANAIEAAARTLAGDRVGSG
jgi:hypothetical protein